MNAGGFCDEYFICASGSSNQREVSATADRKSYGHGCCLTASDQDRLRIFMHEFVVRALIPWAERQMKILSDQVDDAVESGSQCSDAVESGSQCSDALELGVTM